MAHKQQKQFIDLVKSKYTKFFNNVNVLDIGSFDCNGTQREHFSNCEYVGIDLEEGPGVDVVSSGHEYNAPDSYFDTIISCECFEHNPYYGETLQNSLRMLKPGGLLIFTCATEGRPVHGTASLEETEKSKYETWKTLPNVSKENWDNDFYKNILEEDVREFIKVDDEFSEYLFLVEKHHCDLYFYGIKK
jgi:SAM-dependent methyltransferase